MYVASEIRSENRRNRCSVMLSSITPHVIVAPDLQMSARMGTLFSTKCGVERAGPWYIYLLASFSRWHHRLRIAVQRTLLSMWNLFLHYAWASAHKGKWGQMTPLKNGWKWKSENMQKRAAFYVYVIFWEQSGQAGVENGAMLITYLFRCTSECTIS